MINNNTLSNDSLHDRLINNKDTFIDHNIRDHLNEIKTIVPIYDKNYNKILYLINLLTQDVLDEYRYGNSFIDRWITNKRIQKLNKLIKIYNIKIV